MSAWQVAGSLDQLLEQLDALAPDRTRVSDGAIGDVAHQKAGTSDHLPHVELGGQAYVTARDWTHDPKGGLDCHRLYRALVTARDVRVKYVIWDDKITSGAAGTRPWLPRQYRGTNPHRHHLHLSVVADVRCLDDSPWSLPGLSSLPVSPAKRTISIGDRGSEVELVQRWLGVVQPGEPGYGIFGQATRRAVLAYQEMREIEADGVVGAQTWAEMAIPTPRPAPAELS